MSLALKQFDFTPCPPKWRRRKNGAVLWAACSVLERTVGPSVVNLAEEVRKELLWKARDRSQALMTGRVEPIVEKQFQSERKAMAAKLSRASDLDDLKRRVDQVLDGALADWVDTMSQVYSMALPRAAERTWQDFRRTALRRSIPLTKELSGCCTLFPVSKARADQGSRAEGVPRTDRWLNETLHALRRGGKKIRGIKRTTRRQLIASLAEGVEAGENMFQLRKRVDQFYLEQIIPHRSEVIARTEVHEASNLGSRAAATQTGLNLTHQWYTALDDRVRGLKPRDAFSHVAAHAQERPLEEPYEVSGEQLMYPGDSSYGASAGNTIQCRCVELFNTI